MGKDASDARRKRGYELTVVSRGRQDKHRMDTLRWQRRPNRFALRLRLTDDLLPSMHVRLDLEQHDIAASLGPHVGRAHPGPGDWGLQGDLPPLVRDSHDPLNEPSVDGVVEQRRLIRVHRQPESQAQQEADAEPDHEAHSGVAGFER